MPHVFGEPLLFGLRFVAESEVFRKILVFFGENPQSRFPVRTALRGGFMEGSYRVVDEHYHGTRDILVIDILPLTCQLI